MSKPDHDVLAEAVQELAGAVREATEARRNECDDAELLATLVFRVSLLTRRIKAVARAFRRLDNET